jgi:hypothetical protein
MIEQYTEVTTYWRACVGTLAQRGLLRQRKDGQKVIPQAVAIVEPARCVFVLDMLRLAGVSREVCLNSDLWAQIRAALQGRRCFVADGGGLAVVIAREPGEPERKRLPRQVILDAEAIPHGNYTAVLGESRGGPVVLDLAEGERAILIGGTSGSGKTGTIRSLVLQLARKNGPDRLALAVVDLKRLDFTALAGLPHLARPVATTEAGAVDLVAWCVQEMERRQAIMQAAQVTHWDRLPEGDRFPLLLVVIDEVADFARSDVMADLVELARKSRACGFALIAATQRPDADVFSPQAKANYTTRIAFRVMDATNSRIILDRSGAQDLRRVGQCLTNAGGKWRKVQAAFVPDDALGEWVNAPSGPVLDDTERALVAYALDELGGCFTINALADAFQGEVSRRQLLKLGRAWELRGWLTSPEDVTEARQVTAELEALARGNGGNGRGNASGAVVPRGISGNVVPENCPGGGVELPPFLARRYGHNGNAPSK